MIPNIYLITCDESVWITYYTTKLINKYLPNIKIYLLGYSIPNIEYDKNVTFIRLKPKRIKSEWFNDVANYFKNIEDEIIIFSVDDVPIIDDVNINLLEDYINYINDNKVALIYGTYLKRDNKFISENESYIFEESPNHPSLWGLNIWNKKCLIKLLEYDYSNYSGYSFQNNNYLANFEIYGKNILKDSEYMDYKFIYISNKKYAKKSLFFTHIYTLLSDTVYGRNVFLYGLKKEDIKLFYDKPTLYPITFSLLKDRPLRFTYEEIINDEDFYNTCINFLLEQNDKFYTCGFTKKKTIPGLKNHYLELHTS